MAEVGLDFPREWLELADPDDDAHRFRYDLTWLLSRWRCLFGVGCPGIDASRPDDTCCLHGAYFVDAADERRVRAAAAELTPETWQSHGAAARRGIAEIVVEDDDGEPVRQRKTRVVDGVCVFYNRAGFAGGYGCALHHLALRTGRHPMETKPHVCWQVPVAVDHDTVVRPDGTEMLVTTVSEFSRRSWGPGGHDFDWWCSSATEAHTAAEPVYRSYRDELTALLGTTAYAELARHCDERLAGRTTAVHPADPRR